MEMREGHSKPIERYWKDLKGKEAAKLYSEGWGHVARCKLRWEYRVRASTLETLLLAD